MKGRTITEADVVAFANLTGDHHPQHTDAPLGRQGPFGERIAHGMLVLSYAVGLVDFDPERIVALRRIGGRRVQAPGGNRRHDPRRGPACATAPGRRGIELTSGA